MKIIALDQAGGVENLRIQELAAPTPAPGELLVKVRATCVNPADVKLRADDRLLTAFLGEGRPAFLGWDFAGEVAAVGSAARLPGRRRRVWPHPFRAWPRLRGVRDCCR